MLDAQFGDLFIDHIKHGLLIPLNFCPALGCGSDDIECAPGQHASDGV